MSWRCLFLSFFCLGLVCLGARNGCATNTHLGQSNALPGDFSLDGGASGVGNGVALAHDGGIMLTSDSAALHFAWIANSSAGTVSKFDTATGNEVARYYSVIPIDGLGRTDAGVARLTADQANRPSRTAIDLNGAVWVANRAPGYQGSRTKIANDPPSCRPLPDAGRNSSFDPNGDT